MSESTGVVLSVAGSILAVLQVLIVPAFDWLSYCIVVLITLGVLICSLLLTGLSLDTARGLQMARICLYVSLAAIIAFMTIMFYQLKLVGREADASHVAGVIYFFAILAKMLSIKNLLHEERANSLKVVQPQQAKLEAFRNT